MKLIFTTLALSVTFFAFSQNCAYYYFQNNKTVTLGIYNKKGSLDGKSSYKISNVTKTGGTVTANVTSEFIDKKGKSYGQSKGKMQCNGGMLLVDMQMMLSPQQNEQFKNAEVQGKGFYLEYPATVKVGEQLKDGFFNMDMSMDNGISAKVSMDITNRSVLAKESVTTPAGTWEAYKITYISKTVINMGFSIPIKLEMTEWFVPNFGVVKTEHKMGKTELLSIE